MSDTAALRCTDADARRLALLPDRSWLVRAPAGSGKTELLIQRMLALLATVTEPEQVLAITFTIKAAGEMRTRLVEALAAADAPTPQQPHRLTTWRLAKAVGERDRAFGWGLKLNPSRLRIQTIDALCFHIAARHPVGARLGAGVRISQRPEALYREAAMALLQSWGERSDAALDPAASGSPEAVVLRHLQGDRERTIALIGQMLGVRDRWLRHVARGGTEDRRSAGRWRAGLEAALQGVIVDALASVRERTPEAIAMHLPALAAHAAAALAAQGSDSPITACHDLRALPGQSADALDAWLGLRELLLTNAGKPRSSVTVRHGFGRGSGEAGASAAALKAQMLALLQELPRHPGFVRALHSLASLPPPAYSADQWTLIDALTTLLPRAAAYLKVIFAERGEVDFTEVAHAALRALQESQPPDDAGDTGDAEDESAPAGEAALALDAEIRHILVDEFQDTAYVQIELLERLTGDWQPDDGRTLFLVGDPMQSIYRFREAEVRLFRRVQQVGLGALALPLLQLRNNYRSHPALVEQLNQCLAPLFERDDDPEAVPFEPSTGAQPAERFGSPLICGHFGPAIAGSTEAERVVAIVTEALGVEDRTVAILVRGREQLSAILPALGSAGIRFLGVDIAPLRDAPEVRDLHALTRALWHLGDRTAWLTVLRAPWCGLTLNDLHSLAQDGRGRTVWDAVIDQRSRERLSPDGRRRLSRFKGVIASAWGHRARATLRDWVEGTWSALGGGATLPDELASRNVNRYLALLEQVDAGGRLNDIALLEDGLARLYAEPDPKADGRLQIMTIHRAKGLEFDVVILPGMNATPRTAPRPLLDVGEISARGKRAGESHLVIAPIGTRHAPDSIGDYLRHRARQLDHSELLRLIYVALTRAREQIHLTGALTVRGDGTARAAAGSMLALLQDGLKQSGAWHEALDAQDEQIGALGDTTPLDGASPQRLTRLPADWALPPVPVPDVVRAVRPGSDEPLLVPLDGAGEITRHVGRVCHWILSRMAGDAAALSEPGASALSRRVVGALHRAGLRDEALLSAARRTIAAVQGTLGDDRGRWVLSSAHGEAESDVSLSAWMDGRLQQAKVDRTFVCDGERWLIDYRTASHEGGDRERFLQAEVELLRPDLLRAGRLMQLIDERPLRIGVYFPLLQAWRELAPTGESVGRAGR